MDDASATRPTALNGSLPKAPGFAGGSLLKALSHSFAGGTNGQGSSETSPRRSISCED